MRVFICQHSTSGINFIGEKTITYSIIIIRNSQSICVYMYTNIPFSALILKKTNIPLNPFSWLMKMNMPLSVCTQLCAHSDNCDVKQSRSFPRPSPAKPRFPLCTLAATLSNSYISVFLRTFLSHLLNEKRAAVDATWTTQRFWDVGVQQRLVGDGVHSWRMEGKLLNEPTPAL